MSLSAGFEAEDPTGWFGGSFKGSVKAGIEMSVGVSTTIKLRPRSRAATIKTSSSSREPYI